jgi:4-hydroxy 2-oxovalerate aldolase
MTAISEKEGTVKLIATSNLTRTHSKFDYTLDYESLIDRDAVVMDNSFIMLLKVLSRTAVNHVYLAGFDGYTSDADNYYSSKMEYEFVKKLGHDINAYVDRILPELRKQLDITFITSTVYKG